MRHDHEPLGLFEPLMVSEESKHRAKLNDLALELTEKSASFSASLPKEMTVALAELVRSMNCYYSNLIEGHNTHPIDIERAMEGDYSHDPEKRDLQLEAKAHITVQKWIDDGGLSAHPTAPASILEIHQRFCDLMPEDLLWVENPQTGERLKVIPGELREVDVAVGRHAAISPGAVPAFLDRFHTGYSGPGRMTAILAAACAHHRLLWVHPFLDGNGRVARLMSYAMLKESIGTNGLWSVARGLARNEDEYKRHLQSCDGPRRGDLDGRGTLSEGALASFTEFFLKTCIDQIDFMKGLMKPDALRERILMWAEEQMRLGGLPPKSDLVLRELLYRGELARSEVPNVLGLSERAARRITGALIKSGAVTAQTPRSAFKLAFPAALAGRWMPGLFPEG